MKRTGWSVSVELLKNQISLHGMLVRQLIAALPRLVQPQSSTMDKKAKRIAPAVRLQPKRESGIRLERRSAGIQSAVIAKSPPSVGKRSVAAPEGMRGPSETCHKQSAKGSARAASFNHLASVRSWAHDFPVGVVSLAPPPRGSSACRDRSGSSIGRDGSLPNRPGAKLGRLRDAKRSRRAVIPRPGRVPRRVFQRVLPESPTPGRCVEAYYLQRTRFESIAERKLRRRQLTDDGNVEISERDVREMPDASKKNRLGVDYAHGIRDRDHRSGRDRVVAP